MIAKIDTQNLAEYCIGKEKKRKEKNRKGKELKCDVFPA